jgi:hypothetical protein
MTKMRILKSWFYDIFSELRKERKIDFSHPYMGQEGIGGPHRERGTVLAILSQTDLGQILLEEKPKCIKSKNDKILKNSNEELWNLLKRILPVGSVLITPTRKKRNVIYEWQSDQVLYVSEENYLKKNKKR